MHQAERAVTALEAAGFMVGPTSVLIDTTQIPFTNGAIKDIDGKEKMLWAVLSVNSDTDELQLTARIEGAIRAINIAVNQ